MMNGAIMVVGNLTRDPELQFSKSGVAVSKFSVAVTERRRGDSGQWEDGDTSFFRCVAFGDFGEHIAESLQKGDRAFVYGRMKIGTYEKDGEKHVSPEIVVELCGPELKWATTTSTRAPRSSGSARTPEPGDEF